jgi:hypothetical protein
MHLSASEFSLGPQLRHQARAYGAPRSGFGLDRSPWPSGSADRADGKFTIIICAEGTLFPVNV